MPLVLQRLDLRLDHAGRWRRRDGCDLRGQVVALIDIEDREALQERNGRGFLASLNGAHIPTATKQKHTADEIIKSAHSIAR